MSTSFIFDNYKRFNKFSSLAGDEGSPLLLLEADGSWTQIGIFSYQFSLGCDRGWPPVYTRVTSYLDWIAANSDVVIRETWE